MLPASPALPAQHVRLEAKQGSDRSARAPASDPSWGVLLRCLGNGRATLQRLKSSDLGEGDAENPIPDLAQQVPHLLLFIRLLVVRERLLP